MKEKNDTIVKVGAENIINCLKLCLEFKIFSKLGKDGYFLSQWRISVKNLKQALSLIVKTSTHYFKSKIR